MKAQGRIWYYPIAFHGLRGVQLSRSAMAMIAQTVCPPSIRAAVENAEFMR